MSPSAANSWKPEEVVRRWLKLYLTAKIETVQLKIDAILQNEALIKRYRPRLANLSWRMKSNREPIARRANA